MPEAWYNNPERLEIKMGNLKEKWAAVLYKIRNPEYDEHEKEFKRELGAKRLLFLLPFIIAAAIFFLMSLK